MCLFLLQIFDFILYASLHLYGFVFFCMDSSGFVWICSHLFELVLIRLHLSGFFWFTMDVTFVYLGSFLDKLAMIFENHKANIWF